MVVTLDLVAGKNAQPTTNKCIIQYRLIAVIMARAGGMDY